MNDEIQAEGSEVRPGQRIAKVMARAGVCSRREAEAWIAEGRVSVNGEVLKSPAFNVSETDDVRVDGKPLAAPERTRLFLFHKPRGLVTTARDPEGRTTVFAALPPDLPRVVAIGRLDINTEGLLLLTNDGGLARVLELPSTGWLRRYRVRAHGTIDQAALDRLSEGVTIDGVDYLGIEAKLDREQGANAWLTLGLREGKNREIKKILEHLGLAVNRLIRVSFGPFELGDLPEGEVMEVRTRVLRDQLGVKLAKEADVNFDAPQIVARCAAAQSGGKASGREPSADRARTVGPSERCKADRIVERAGARIGSNGTPRRAARPRNRPRLSADANMSRLCARKSPQTPRPRASASSAARPTTARGEQSRSSACPGLAKRRTRGAPEARPKRAGRPNAGERGGRSFESSGRAGRGDSFGPKRRSGAAGGRERPPRPDQKEPGRRPERSNAARSEGGPRERRFDRPPARSEAIVEIARRERGTATIRRASASLTGLRAGRVPKPAKAGRRDRTTRSRRAARTPLRPSAKQKRDGDRRERPSRTRDGADPARERKFDRPQGRTRTQAGEGRPPRSDDKNRGPRSDFKSRPPRAGARDGDRPQSRGRGAGGKADRRAVAPQLGGALAAQEKDRRKAPAVHAGRRESRDRCGSSAAASRVARC